MSKPKRYDPAAIETKWQSRWENEKTYACHVDKDKKKYYVLEMFPYPSGNLHMGHVRNYSIGDVVARFKRMQGFNVMHPMGWDAFGLPAENAAIKHNIHPSVWTHANIDNMRAQLKRLGYSYDWDREVATCDEPYYRWEQLFFLRWLEKGLVYRKKASQNWCPHCNTVLANEQVVDGLCWRCDTPVVQKELTQWFLKITDYADELLADLSKLEGGWPDRVLSMQRNWIGKSVGAEITFPLESGEGDIKVFTTRPDTVFGVTFMTLAPEHPLVESLISGKPNEAEARAFIERTHNMDRIDRQSDSLEKEGVFTGSYCLNPFTGRQVPIWLGNFVLAEYGTGAVMAVPAHDQRDFDFSKKYGMERIVVIQPEGEAPLTPENLTEAYTAPGVLVNSGEFDGLPNEDAKKAIADALEASGKGKRTTNWRLRDWNISRQRYWGAPIPVVYCDTWFPCPKTSSRSACRWTCRRTRTASLPCPTRPNSTTAPARSAAVRPSAKPTRWTPLLNPRGTSPAIPTPATTRLPSTWKPCATGCPWTSTSAAWSTPSCICSMPASSPRCCAISATSPRRSTSLSPTCSRRAWF